MHHINGNEKSVSATECDTTKHSLHQSLHHTKTDFSPQYRGADKSLARPRRKQATATEDFDVHISYLLSQLEEY